MGRSSNSPGQDKGRWRLSTLVADDGEIVQFPVPRRYLPDVVRLLARLMDPGGPRGDDRTRPWTIDEFRKLRPMLASRPTALTLLDITANLEDESLTFAELCETAAESRGKARGELASLTTIVRKQFNHEQWPVDAQWEEGRLSYRMAPDIAKLWRAVAEGL